MDVVTGAGGFAGRWLVRHLRNLGRDVTGWTRPGGRSGEGAARAVDVTDARACRRAVVELAPERLYHLAACAHPLRDTEAAFDAVNVRGARNVLRAVAEEAPSCRVLVVSSAVVYAPKDAPLGEDDPLRGREASPYARSKLAAEAATREAVAAGVHAVIVRPFNHTGPGQRCGYVVPDLIARLAQARASARRELPVGNLNVVRDLTDVRDVVRAYERVLDVGRPGEVFNVCSGRGVSIRELVGMLVVLHRDVVTAVEDASLDRANETPFLVGDPSRIRARTGWRPEISLEKCLAAMRESDAIR